MLQPTAFKVTLFKVGQNYTAYEIKTTCCFRLKLKPMFLTSLKILQANAYN